MCSGMSCLNDRNILSDEQYTSKRCWNCFYCTMYASVHTMYQNSGTHSVIEKSVIELMIYRIQSNNILQ